MEEGQRLDQLVGDVLLDDVVAVVALDQVPVVLQHRRQRVRVVLRHCEALLARLDEALVRQQVRVLAVHGGLQEGGELCVKPCRHTHLGAKLRAGKRRYRAVAEHARLVGLARRERGSGDGVERGDDFG